MFRPSFTNRGLGAAQRKGLMAPPKRRRTSRIGRGLIIETHPEEMTFYDEEGRVIHEGKKPPPVPMELRLRMKSDIEAILRRTRKSD
jgi:hypothetical protein